MTSISSIAEFRSYPRKVPEMLSGSCACRLNIRPPNAMRMFWLARASAVCCSVAALVSCCATRTTRSAFTFLMVSANLVVGTFAPRKMTFDPRRRSSRDSNKGVNTCHSSGAQPTRMVAVACGRGRSAQKCIQPAHGEARCEMFLLHAGAVFIPEPADLRQALL